jgi:hypothetical protein
MRKVELRISLSLDHVATLCLPLPPNVRIYALANFLAALIGFCARFLVAIW